MFRLLWVHSLAFHIDLAFHELVKPLHHLFLAARDLKLLLIEPDSVSLAARPFKVILVIVGAAAPPASVHQLLVVVNCHLCGCDAPLVVAFWLLRVTAVTTAIIYLIIRVAAINVKDCFCHGLDHLFLVLLNYID